MLNFILGLLTIPTLSLVIAGAYIIYAIYKKKKFEKEMKGFYNRGN